MVKGIGINDMPRGWRTQSLLNEKIYSKWSHMLLRCTKKYQEKHPTYKGVTICERWIRLSNFIEDIKKMKGYDYFSTHLNENIHLDKDILSDNNNKIYCLEQCILVKARENIKQSTKHRNNDYLYNNKWSVGKHLSEETKNKISESLKGESNPFYGKHHTEEAKRKISENHGKPMKDKFGKDNHLSNKFIRYNPKTKTYTLFFAMREAERNGYDRKSISLCCRKLKEDYKGYLWFYLDDFIKFLTE